MARQTSDSASGADARLARTISENRPFFLEIAYSVVRNSCAAEDIVDEACLKLLRAVKQAPVKDLMPYCCTVVKNLAIDHHRRSAFEREHFYVTSDVDNYGSSHINCPYRRLNAKQTAARIVDILSELPEITQQIFIMYRLEGMTQRDIASVMDCSLGGVNGHIASADEALKECRNAFLDP